MLNEAHPCTNVIIKGDRMSEHRYELRKIVGSPGSDGVNSCPTVMGYGDDQVVLQGYRLSDELRRELNIPDGENAVIMPRAMYVEGARRIVEDG
jgi:hypothetical protein